MFVFIFKWIIMKLLHTFLIDFHFCRKHFRPKTKYKTKKVENFWSICMNCAEALCTSVAFPQIPSKILHTNRLIMHCVYWFCVGTLNIATVLGWWRNLIQLSADDAKTTIKLKCENRSKWVFDIKAFYTLTLIDIWILCIALRALLQCCSI